MMYELKPCPFCGSDRHLNFQYRQARGSRRGKYDSSIYCRKCGCFGARVKSETLGIEVLDVRNEIPTKTYKEAMRAKAIEAWNRRAEE